VKDASLKRLVPHPARPGRQADLPVPQSGGGPGRRPFLRAPGGRESRGEQGNKTAVTPMPKPSVRFVCQNCGYEAPRWMGRCPDCSQWATIVEEQAAPPPASARPRAYPLAAPEPLSSIDFTAEHRLSTGISELDRVLGGGLVPGSVVLIGGDPGIGKSTLLMQASGHLAGQGTGVLYVSGEESPRQIRMRSRRLGVDSERVWVSSETDASALESLVESAGAGALVIDSIQTMSDPSSPSAPGTVSQVRSAAAHVAALARARGIPAFLVGHVTKDGSLAGPRVLEHMVDTVLYFEGDRDSSYRILRAVKNRFGATDEVGIFEMSGAGLSSVENPSAALLAERDEKGAGSVVCPVLEGTRPLLVEVQALAAPTHFPSPRRMASGVDFNRLLLVLAVLEKRAGLRLGQADVYANVTGGLRLSEPAADLALAVAVASSLNDRPLPPGTAVLGEIGLSGEVRGVQQAERRAREAVRLGFARLILSRRDARAVAASTGADCVGVRTVAEAVRVALEGESG